MNSKDYFVMLTTQSGEYTPLMDGDDIAKFTTVEDARKAATEAVFGKQRGFNIFDICDGI